MVCELGLIKVLKKKKPTALRSFQHSALENWPETLLKRSPAMHQLKKKKKIPNANCSQKQPILALLAVNT